MFIVTYDEHGGFYDHVNPDPADDDYSDLRSYGVRVPALVISPWVKRKSVCHETLDHTSILRTLQVRFCKDPQGRVPWLGRRVAAAKNLSVLMSADPDFDVEEIQEPRLLEGDFIDQPDEETDLQKDFREIFAQYQASGEAIT